MRCDKCDIEKVKIVYENIDNLSLKMVRDFIFTFDVSCSTNIEYSEWSNEILYKLHELDPGKAFGVLERVKVDNIEIILDEIENPIHEVDYQKVYDSVLNVLTKSDLKKKVLKSIEFAANKEGLEIIKE